MIQKLTTKEKLALQEWREQKLKQSNKIFHPVQNLTVWKILSYMLGCYFMYSLIKDLFNLYGTLSMYGITKLKSSQVSDLYLINYLTIFCLLLILLYIFRNPIGRFIKDISLLKVILLPMVHLSLYVINGLLTFNLGTWGDFYVVFGGDLYFVNDLILGIILILSYWKMSRE